MIKICFLCMTDKSENLVFKLEIMKILLPLFNQMVYQTIRSLVMLFQGFKTVFYLFLILMHSDQRQISKFLRNL